MFAIPLLRQTYFNTEAAATHNHMLSEIIEILGVFDTYATQLLGSFGPH